MKETDVTDIRMGQPARIRVDAFPGRTWDAEVDSLSAGTGSEFALLPPQNATGNWVKVTQRVPVRLKLKRNADDPPLRIGMSAQVEIDTRDTTPTAAEKTLAGGTTASQLR
jgi:membrane fusion protein (multidrug efflux system)